MLADPHTSAALSKMSIVDWVNTSIEPSQNFSCVKDIPSKVAAAFMNDIFGDSAFPMRGVNFNYDEQRRTAPQQQQHLQHVTEDFQVAKRNCDAVLEGAALLGFQPTFTGHSWADGVKDFGGVLLFWRWLRQKSLEKPLSRCMPASEIGLAPSPSSSGHNHHHPQGLAPADSNTRNNQQPRAVLRLSDVAAAAVAGGVGPNLENAAPTAVSGAAGAGASSSSALSAPFVCGGANGAIAKQLFEANFKELTQMRKVHDELAKAVSDGNLSKIIAVLQQAHHGI